MNARQPGRLPVLLFTLAALLLSPQLDASRALTSGAANASAPSYLETRIGASEIEGRDLVGALGALSAEERSGYAASSGGSAAGEHLAVLVHNGGLRVPSVRKGRFKRWFNRVSDKTFEKFWADRGARRAIKDRLRHPGKMHEWLMVARADVFKRWGVTAEQIAADRSLIEGLQFRNPIGRHGGRGSGLAHQEVLGIIDTSLNYEAFRRRLQNWAHDRFVGGAEALPGSLRLRGE